MERRDETRLVRGASIGGAAGVRGIAPWADGLDGRPRAGWDDVPSSRANPRSIWQLPRGPAVYVLYGGGIGERDVAYVGEADVLVRRVVEQLVVRDPLVLAESPVVALLPFYVAEIRWWLDPAFADPQALHAAELIAAELFDPPLRGRSRTSEQAFTLYGDHDFRRRMIDLFRGEPAGALRLPTHAHALEWLAELELRLRSLERRGEPSGARLG